MLVTNRKLRASSPFTLGDNVIFQSFGVDVIKTYISPSKDTLKTSEDFIGYSEEGKYSSASYSRNMYKEDDKVTFNASEVCEITFDDSDTV